MTVIGKRPVTAGLIDVLVEEVVDDIEAGKDAGVLATVAGVIEVTFETIERLLSIDCGSPKTIVVVV